jgi:DNA-binding response OmpR family regulator
VTIKRLRTKLRQPELIQAVRGQGYRLTDGVAG